LHVKKETLVNIPNVLDELNKSITLDWNPKTFGSLDATDNKKNEENNR